MNKFRFAWAIRQTFSEGYHWTDLKRDLFAGFVVSLIALPLSMALAISIGLPPQHGIYTAIIAGIAAALFGGSHYQISGPTAAFVVILIPILTELGLKGLIWCQLIAGVFLIALSLARTGALIRYVPITVMTGFTAGIALVLATLSLKSFLGLAYPDVGHSYLGKLYGLITHFKQIDWPQTGIAIWTLVTLIWCKKHIKIIPAPMIAIMGSAFISWILIKMGIDVATIGSQFEFKTSTGELKSGIPPYLPSFSALVLPTWNELQSYLKPAMIITVLAALETLLSASIADNMTQSRHHSHAELAGIGIANILSSFAMGIPATAAIARTATNIQYGARSPFAAIFHALFILLYVVMLSPLINQIPMAALAALLILTAYNMSHLQQVKDLLKTAPSTDKIVLLASFLLTVFIDMVAGIVTGILIAGLAVLIKKKTTVMS